MKRTIGSFCLLNLLLLASVPLVAMLQVLQVVMVEMDYRLQSLDLLPIQRVLVH